jgi:hypothetical protein
MEGGTVAVAFRFPGGALQLVRPVSVVVVPLARERRHRSRQYGCAQDQAEQLAGHGPSIPMMC